MYSKNESPILRASIFYYDDTYNINTSTAVLDTLLKYGFFPPDKIYAGSLTNNKFINYNKNTADLFIKAYCEQGILDIDMASGNNRKTADYWRIDWGLTFVKNQNSAAHSSKLKPWNIFTIDSTYGRLKSLSVYKSYIECVKELITILNPFYASIDDVSNKVYLMDKANETHFVPDRIQQVFWGNYWDDAFYQKYNVDLFQIIPFQNIKRINNGIFFTLTESAFDFNSDECKKNRKKIICSLN